MKEIINLYSAAAFDALGNEWKDSNEVIEKRSAFVKRLKEICGEKYDFEVESKMLELAKGYEKQGFCIGFKLGARLMMEVLSDE